MTATAVVVLVVGVLAVALIAVGALLAQRRRDRAPARRGRPVAPTVAVAPSAPVAPPAPTTPTTSTTPTSSPPPRREESRTEPITTRTAQADPPTVTHSLSDEGERHPTPPPHGGNGRAP